MTKVLGKGRGMVSLETWLPCRRPGQPRDPNIKPVNIVALLNTASKPKQTEENAENGPSQKGPPTPPSLDSGSVNLVAKYNYKSNPNRPGGFDEMSLAQGERLTFIAPHSLNPYWWQAKRENGECAYVPATYVMVLENKVTSLPWLEEKKAAKEQEAKERAENGEIQQPVFKPYQSAYNKVDSSNVEPTPSKNYYCEVCDKSLNGIKPYQAHMVSKAHKEEVALAELYRS